MKVDAIVMGQPTRTVPELAREVAGGGFDGLWFTESGRPAYDGCVAAGLADTGLDIGTAIAVAFPRSPMVTAQVAWDLADLTGGRFVLGLGTQVKAHIQRRYGAEFDHPGPRLREYVLAVQACFAAFAGDAPLEFRGQWWQLDLLPSAWSPGAIDHPAPPIYVAAVNQWMLRMAGEVADGVHVHPVHGRRYIDEVVRPTVAEGAIAAGRDPDSIALVCPVMVAAGDTDESRARAVDDVRGRIAFYGSTRTYRTVFERHGWDEVPDELHRLQRAGDFVAMARTITDEMVDTFAIVGRWDEIGDRLVERYADVADRVILYDATPQWLRDPAAFKRWSAVVAACRART